ncbi:tyrosine-protein phosphatase [Streptomyces sp. DSM 44915]|uniref:Tyrosine-protein phosphatase n=1 Tax=Streptomyces chisholmiae TaxID=3075540 RepID=A0ABU2JVW5_9ACTN|nr:tyrosine-protein phosphatase [Streptomyces sp. DSM 44915]MDT0268373.1 tyrosine-protein phosphatase [Streptomyces sp. DSM 44915]
MTEVPTEPTLTAVRNFRDVGGLPTADGRRLRPARLYRSGHLAHATAEDRAFLDSLGLRAVFDFRNTADLALDGHDVALAGARNINIPLSDPADGAAFWELVRRGEIPRLRAELAGARGGERMAASYRQMVRTRTAEHGRVLRALATGDTPALLHCAAGKDRAGLTVAVVLLALGVSRATITEDYLKSNAPHRRYRWTREPAEPAGPAAEGAAGLDPEIATLLSPMFEARAEYLAAAYTTIDDEWGGTDAYLTRGLGLDTDTRERLRTALLTED